MLASPDFTIPPIGSSDAKTSPPNKKKKDKKNEHDLIILIKFLCELNITI